MKNLFLLFFILVLTLSCEHKVQYPEIDSLIFGYKTGLIAGIGIGDRFNEHERMFKLNWSLRKNAKFVQLKKVWGQENLIKLEFTLNEKKEVEEMYLFMRASEANSLNINKIENDFLKKFTVSLEQDKNKNWIYLDENRIIYTVKMNVVEQNETKKSISVHVFRMFS